MEKNVKLNVGKADKIIRLSLVVLIVALYYLEIITGKLAIVFALLVGILFLTATTGICPLYSILEISTRKKSN